LRPQSVEASDNCRQLKLRSDIYQLSWALTIKNAKLPFENTAFVVPTSQVKEIIFGQMIFCAICQVFVSILLLRSFEAPIPVSWDLEIIRFVCATLFHFEFAREIKVAIDCLKYTAMHYDDFHYHWFAPLSVSL
jgi:hypothetical protein